MERISESMNDRAKLNRTLGPLHVWALALGAFFYGWQAREFRSIPKQNLDRLVLDV